MAHKRGFLHVIVHSAKGLPASDVKILKQSSSDPYCVLTFRGEHRRTKTIYECLTPVWEDAFSFQEGTYLPEALLTLLGETPGAQKDLLDCNLGIAVFDEDRITSDDLLGHYDLDVGLLLTHPGTWVTQEIKLAGTKKKIEATVKITVCWQAGSWLPPYLLRLGSVVAFSTAAAMQLIAANCRWQPAAVLDGAMKQPGVGAAVCIGSGALLVATCLHFISAHFQNEVAIDDLVAGINSMRVRSQKRSHGLDHHDAALKIGLRSTGLTCYDVHVTPTIDFKLLQLPVIALKWLLPLAGTALGAVALALQTQDNKLCFCAGEFCTLLSLGSSVFGLLTALSAEQSPALDDNSSLTLPESTRVESGAVKKSFSWIR